MPSRSSRAISWIERVTSRRTGRVSGHGATKRTRALRQPCYRQVAEGAHRENMKREEYRWLASDNTVAALITLSAPAMGQINIVADPPERKSSATSSGYNIYAGR
jgi:hypothetical protein